MEMQMLDTKKGQGIGEISAFVMILVVVGISLAIGLTVMSSIQSNQWTSTAGSNVTGNWNLSTTATTVSSLRDCAFTTVVIKNTNGTDTLVATGNYTTANNPCTITGINTSGYYHQFVNITANYTYNHDSVTSNITNGAITAGSAFSEWFAIIVIVFAAAVILGLVLSNLGGKREG